MAFASSCCLNISTPTPASAPSLSPKTPHVVSWKNNEGSWRKRCVLGMACMIIGSEMSNSVIDESHNIAIAQEQMLTLVGESNTKGTKWSDKRTCPAWRVNSLETIVPENLPRPSARRRWEAVGYAKNAPAVVQVSALRTSTNCFSL